jgi:hypothetical protein
MRKYIVALLILFATLSLAPSAQAWWGYGPRYGYGSRWGWGPRWGYYQPWCYRPVVYRTYYYYNPAYWYFWY